MATTVVLTDVIKEPGGRVLVRFQGGIELEFASLAEVQEFAQEPDLDEDLTQKLCISWILHRSNDLSNINPIQNKNFIFDLSAGNPIRVQ